MAGAGLQAGASSPGQKQVELVPAFSPVSNQIPELSPPSTSQGLVSEVSALPLGSGTGRNSLGNVASWRSLTAGLDADRDPASCPGGDKGGGALSLCLGVLAVAKLPAAFYENTALTASIRPFRTQHVPDGAQQEAAGTCSDGFLEEALVRGLLPEAWQVGDLEGGMVPCLVISAGWSPPGLGYVPGSEPCCGDRGYLGSRRMASSLGPSRQGAGAGLPARASVRGGGRGLEPIGSSSFLFPKPQGLGMCGCLCQKLTEGPTAAASPQMKPQTACLGLPFPPGTFPYVTPASPHILCPWQHSHLLVTLTPADPLAYGTCCLSVCISPTLSALPR